MYFTKFHLSKKWQTTSLVITGIIAVLATALVISGFNSTLPSDESPSPNILVILLGDVGYSDVSWNNPGVRSPTLETMMKSGIRLDKYYTHPSDVGSRAELLTGQFSHRLKGKLKGNRSGTSLAERLRNLGYVTHFIGKWQLEKQTPAEMGFDTFYGSLRGDIDPWTKCTLRGDRSGKMEVDWTEEENNTYSRIHANDLITSYTVSVLEEHDPNLPLFVMLSFMPPRVIHQTPVKYKSMFANRKDVWRQEFLAYMKHLDDSLNNIIQATADMSSRELYTIAISDGGHSSDISLSSRFPLRGGPGSVFEGGIRVPAFITGGKTEILDVNKPFHVTDWMPTIMALVRSPLNSSIDDFDGIDQSGTLKMGSNIPGLQKLGSCRIIIHAISDPPFNYTGRHPFNLTTHGNVSVAAVSCGPYKLVLDTPGVNDEWTENISLRRKAGKKKAIAYEYKSWNANDSKCNGSLVISEDVVHRDPSDAQIYSFNLDDDPEETNDISKEQPDVVNNLLKILNCHASFISFPFTNRYECLRKG